MERLIGLPYVADARSRLLILGSMPGAVSLARSQYYGHERNRFWPLLFRYFGQPFSADYGDRLALIGRGGIALWDTVASCARTGSLDSDIKEATVNDIPRFLAEHPHIVGVAVNGKTSFAYLRRAFPMVEAVCLPSTSPANASFSADRLYAEWKPVLDRFLSDKIG